MAKTIPQLTDATTVNAADELIIQQSGITKRATGAELAKGLNTINGTRNVKDFGAVGNGVTDDTSAVLAAAAAGARLAIDGDYLVTDLSIISDIENWKGTGRFIFNSTALPVGPVTSFPTIQAAIDFAEAKTFKDEGFIQIKIADGTYNNLTQIEPILPNGADRLEIVGNTTNPGNVQLNFDATNNKCGFLFQRGNGIYKIDGLTINGVGARVSAGVWNLQAYGAGIMANYNSQILVGSKVEVRNFYYGIASRYASSVRCEAGVIVRNAGDCGFFTYGASMDCQDCQAYDVSHVAEGLGFGFCSEAGAFMDCSRSNTSGNNRAGFYANGGRMWAKEITSDNNSGDGVLSINGGNIECNPPTGGVASNSYLNGGCGYFADNNSYINCNSCISDDNTGDGYKSRNCSVIDITASAASDNTGNGYFAVDGSGMTGNSAEATDNSGDGFRADTKSWFRGSSHSSNSNGGWGYFAQNLSFMNIPSSGGTLNTSGFDSPAVAGTAGNNGSYIQN
jgi:hypothetical protein